MDDPGKFSSMAEYHVLFWAVGLLLVSECAIWLFALRGARDRSKQRRDGGTVCLIILAWWLSFWLSVFFRSQSVPEGLRSWLLPHFFYYLGILCIAGGVVLRCTAVWTLKRAFTLSVQTTPGQHLIQTGPYGFVRNPAYTGSILSLLGIALAYRHILGALSVLLLCLLCYGIRIRVEERALSAQFPEEFTQYCKTVRYRLLPGVY